MTRFRVGSIVILVILSTFLNETELELMNDKRWSDGNNDQNVSDNIEIEVDMGDRELTYNNTTRNISAEEGWASTTTIVSLDGEFEYTIEFKMMDHSVSPPVEMYCNNWPSTLSTGPCISIFTLGPGAGGYTIPIHYPVLENSTDACLEVTLTKHDTDETEWNIACWHQQSLSDWDYDGVIDIIDICGDTPQNSTVDEHGCASFQIPNNDTNGNMSSDTDGNISTSTSSEIPALSVVLTMMSIVFAAIIVRSRD